MPPARPLDLTTIGPARKPGWSWWVLAALATAVGGYGILLQDGRPRTATVPGMPWLDTVHFLAGGVALAGGVWAFRRDVLLRHRNLHRRLGQLYVACALVSGTAGLAMACFSAGGLSGHAGFAALAVAWIATSFLGWRRIRAGDLVRHRRWMVRSYAVCCAAISLRVQLPLLALATGSFHGAFAIVAWGCWVPNLLFAEWWLANTDLAGRGLVRGAPS